MVKCSFDWLIQVWKIKYNKIKVLGNVNKSFGKVLAIMMSSVMHQNSVVEWIYLILTAIPRLHSNCNYCNSWCCVPSQDICSYFITGGLCLPSAPSFSYGVYDADPTLKWKVTCCSFKSFIWTAPDYCGFKCLVPKWYILLVILFVLALRLCFLLWHL